MTIGTVHAWKMLTVVLILGTFSLLSPLKAQKTRGGDLPRGVSLIQLIALPNKYDGQKVMVMGVLALENEGAAIYVTSDDYTHASRYNRVRIQRTRVVDNDCERAEGQYVVIGGNFIAPSPNEDSTGMIADITRCSTWSYSNPAARR